MGNKGEVVQRWLPKRIILVRHGENFGSKDDDYIAPDHKTRLTQQGVEQAKQAGSLVRQLLDNESGVNWKVHIYVSPYECTRSTLREMGRAFPRSKVIGVREECRVREQDFGNFRDAHKLKQLKEIRNKFGRFFYRFPEGESGADVYDRVSSFLESLWRDIDMKRYPHDPTDELNLIIVSHGLAIRIFLMRWFRWTVEQFEQLKNPNNGEFRVMQLSCEGGEYSLAIHHDEETLEAWGLSAEMIADQKLRAAGPGGRGELPWWYDEFFHASEDVAPDYIMSRRYDSRTTIFSPEGRLYQVEYAMEAIGNAGSAIGILSKDGVVLVGEKKVTSKLLQTSASTEKMYKIDDHVACAVAGIMSDANILINTARVQAQRYALNYQEPMPVEQLVQSLCDTKQGYTQFGGLRPFGVSFLFAGWDKNYGFQLYVSDPSGNYSGWKAAAIGANNQAAQSMLKQDYKDEITREEAIQLAIKVLSKTMDSTSLTSEKLELAEVFVSNGKVKYQVCSPEALGKLLLKSGVTQPPAETS